MRGAVLQRLETADRLAELPTVLQVSQRHRHGAGTDAQHFRRGAGAHRVERPGQAGPAAVHISDDRIGVDRNAIKTQPCREAGIGEAFRDGGQIGGAFFDREQRDAAGFAGRAGGAGRDDQQVGDMAMRDELLIACQLETVTRPFRAECDAIRAVTGGFVDRQRGDGFAGGDFGQPTLPAWRPRRRAVR